MGVVGVHHLPDRAKITLKAKQPQLLSPRHRLVPRTPFGARSRCSLGFSTSSYFTMLFTGLALLLYTRLLNLTAYLDNVLKRMV